MARAGATLLVALSTACGEELPVCEHDADGVALEAHLWGRAAAAGGAPALERSLDVPGLGPADAAFNPGLVRYRGRLVGAFRLEARSLSPTVNSLAVATLAEDFAIDGPVSHLRAWAPAGHPGVAEDPRLVEHAGALFLTYNVADTPRVMGPRSLRLARLSVDPSPEGWRFAIADDRRLVFADAAGEVARVAKNWAPFDHGGVLHFIHHARPLEVIRLDPQALVSPGPFAWCRPVSLDPEIWPWRYGHPRGGTPAVWDEDGGRYVTFFHSRRPCRPAGGGRPTHQYVAGALAFSGAPPFRVEAVLPHPVVTASFLADLPSPRRTIFFPSGLVLDPARVTVSFGRNDADSGVVALDRAELLGRLVPVLRAQGRPVGA